MARDYFTQDPLDRALGLPAPTARGALRPGVETSKRRDEAKAARQPALDPIDSLSAETGLPPNLLLALGEREDGPALARDLSTRARAGEDLRTLVRGLPDGDRLAERANAIADERAGVAPEPEGPGVMSRLGSAFRLGEAAAIDRGHEFAGQIEASVEEGPLGRGLDRLGRSLLLREDGELTTLGRVVDRFRGLTGLPGVGEQLGQTPAERAAAMRAEDKAEDKSGHSPRAIAQGIAADIARSGFQMTEWSDVNGLASGLAFVGENIAASLPQMGAAIASGPLGVISGPIILGAEANRELMERTDLDEATRLQVAAGAGVAMWALDTIGLGHVLGGLLPSQVANGAITGRLAAALTRRGIPGAAARVIQAGIVEGSTEALQEGIVMGATAASGGRYTPEEVAERLTAAFAGGAGAGGGIRAVGEPFAALRGQPEQTTPPGLPAPPLALPPPTGPAAGPGAAPPPAGPAAPPPLEPDEADDDFDPSEWVMGQEATGEPRAENPVTGEVLTVPEWQEALASRGLDPSIRPRALPVPGDAPAGPGAGPGGPLPVPGTTGPLQEIAALAPRPVVVEEPPEPQPLFPDMKPGAEVTLRLPTGRDLPVVFLREEGAEVVVRDHGRELRIPAEEFDAARLAAQTPADEEPPAPAPVAPAVTPPPLVPGEPPRATAQTIPPLVPENIVGGGRPSGSLGGGVASGSGEPAGDAPGAGDDLGGLGGADDRAGAEVPAGAGGVPGAADVAPTGPRIPKDIPSALTFPPFRGGDQAAPRAPEPQGAMPPPMERPSILAPENMPAPEPTEAQQEAGNYKKGHLRWNGLDVSIETAKGQERRGKAKDGTEWSVTMPADYGYFRGTEARDGDHVDVYMGPDPESDAIFVVDQVDAETGQYDEPKVMVGFGTRRRARDAFVAGFSDGRGAARIGGIKAMTTAELKAWLASDDTKKPVAMSSTEAPPSSGHGAPASGSAPVPASEGNVGVGVGVSAEVASDLTSAERQEEPAKDPEQTSEVPASEPVEDRDTTASPKPPRKRGTKAQREAAERLERLADYFASGNIVRSYGDTFDRVLAFNPGEDGNWSVEVEAVERRGEEWVPTADSFRRTHRTDPSERNLRGGPVERGEVAQEEPATAPAEEEPSKKEPASEPDVSSDTAPREDSDASDQSEEPAGQGSDASDGARFRRQSASPAVRIGESEVRSPAVEGHPVELNMDFADGASNADADPPAAPADLRAIAQALNAELARHGLTGKVTARAVGRILSLVDGHELRGSYKNGRIIVTTDPALEGDPPYTMRHEIVHALRDARLWGREYGAFTQEEWRTLVRAARADKEIMAWAREAYPDLSEADQVEEAIAELYAEWAQSNLDGGRIAKAFGKIKAVLTALANALRGRSFESKATIFERMAKGEVGGRGPRGPGGPGGGREKESRSAGIDVVDIVRPASTFEAALAAAAAFRGQPLINRATGLTATVSGRNLDKMLSQKAVHKSITPAIHAAVVANVDRIFEGAYRGWEHPERSGDRNVARVWRMLAPVRLQSGSAVLAKLTVKEMRGEGRANPIYTVEAVEVVDASSGAAWIDEAAAADGIDLKATRSPEDVLKIVRAVAEINAGPVRERRLGPPRDPSGRFAPSSSWLRSIPRTAKAWKDQGLFSSILTDAMGGRGGDKNLLALVPLRPLLTELARDMHSARSYLRAKEQMDTLRQERQAQAASIVDEWSKLNRKGKAENANLMDLMHRSTIAGIDPTKPVPINRYLTADDKSRIREEHAALKAEFDALPEPYRAMFVKVRDHYTKIADEFDEALIQNLRKSNAAMIKRAERDHRAELRRIDDEGLTGDERKKAKDAADRALKAARARGGWVLESTINGLRAQFETNRLKGPYFPLARFGAYFVTARDDTGAVVHFSRHESEADQKRMAEQMKSDGLDVQVGVLEDKAAVRKQVDPDFVADVEKILEGLDADHAIKDAVWQRWLETLPDQSIRTNRIHRKGRRGFNADAIRAFAHHTFHAAHQFARLSYGIDLSEALAEARLEAKVAKDPNRASLIVNEMDRRHAFIMSPTNAAWTAAASGIGFLWFLGASPAAAIANLSQTSIVGPAILGAAFPEAGVTGAIKQTSRAVFDLAGRTFSDPLKSPRLSADERDALEEAYDRGVIDKTQSHDLAAVAETGVEYRPGREKVMRVASFLFHRAEVLNRTSTFLAAYRMARAANADREAAIQKAADLTWKTHFSYANTDRPRAMQADIPKVLLQFRQFSVNMLFRFARDLHQMVHGESPEVRKEARTQFVALSLSMLAHAGIRGTWGYGIITTLLGLFFEGGDDDVERYLQDALLLEGGGPGTAAWNFSMGLLLNGIPGHVFGVDVTERIGMPNLWFRDEDYEMEITAWWDELILEQLGPVVGLSRNIVRGAEQVWSGEVQRGVETMSPKAVRDLLRAGRFLTEGVETRNGDEILPDVGLADAIKQGLGFTPAAIAERYDANSRLANRERRIERERSAILDAVAEDVAGGGTLSEGTLDRLRAFNAEWPTWVIDSESIRRSLRARSQRRAGNEFGLEINPRLNARLRAEEAPLLYGE